MNLSTFIARAIDSLLSHDVTANLGKTFLARIIRDSQTNTFAADIRKAFNLIQKEKQPMAGYTEDVLDALSSSDEETMSQALENILDVEGMGYGPEIGYGQEIGLGPDIVGFSLKSISKKLKKAGNAVKKAAKSVKKHDFKKDIHALNKVGKMVGPIAAAAPPPYGPAIAGGLMILDAADKANQGAIDKIDVSKVMAAAGVENAEGIQDIMTVAQNVKNNIKATGLIEAVNAGNAAATAKLKAIKSEALKGNPVAKDALVAVKDAQAGRKLEPKTKAILVAKTAPKDETTTALVKASRVVTTPSGKSVSVVNRHDHGAALLLQMMSRG